MDYCKSFLNTVLIILLASLSVLVGEQPISPANSNSMQTTEKVADCGCDSKTSLSKTPDMNGTAIMVPMSQVSPAQKESQVLVVNGNAGTTTLQKLVLGNLSDPSGKNWQTEGIFANFSPYDEVIEQRNAFTKTFRISDEDYQAVISSGPVHYSDEFGAWQDIGTEFSDLGDVIVSRENVFQTRFPKQSTDSYSIVKEDAAISLSYFKNMRIETPENISLRELDAPNRHGRLYDGEIVFAASDGFGREVVRLGEIGIEHDLILDEIPEICASLPENAKYLAIDQDLHIPEDCEIFLNRDPSIMAGKKLTIINSEGKTIYEIPLPNIREANDRIDTIEDYKGVSEAIGREEIFGDFRLIKSGDHYSLTTLVPLDWLASPDRIYPVIIDPTITCYIFTSPPTSESSGFSEGTNCYCGESYCGDHVWATGANTNLGWMFFNIGAIPDGYTINSVNWHAYCYARNYPWWELRAMSQRTFNCTAYRTSCTSGTVMLTQNWSSSEPTGWKSYYLNSSGISVLQSRLGDGWFGTGIRDWDSSSSYYTYWYGFYYSSYRPYLVVNYTAVSCGTTNHGGANWTISSNTTAGGTHTNVGTFTVNSGVTLTVAGICKFLTVEANTINIYGTIDAISSGENGGGGGSGGGYAYGSESSCHGGYGGTGGSSGTGSGGGSGGYSGGTGGCERQDCGFLCIGGDDGHNGGGGGAGGGGGGAYGGSGGYGGYGAYGASFSGASGGSYGSGGSRGSTYGSASGYDVTWGSGGGGAGGGGGGYASGTNGSGGGDGGGEVNLIASGNLTLSSTGRIYANGSSGSAGGNGGGESTSNDFNCSCDGYNGCCFDAYEVFDASGGAAGGGGGGSGGGISLMAAGVMNLSGYLQAIGGSGGVAGIPSPAYGSCHDYAKGGAGGGGGRIKVIYSSCLSGSHTLSPSVNRSGGAGGTGYSSGYSGYTGSYNIMTIPVTTVTTNPAGLQIVVDGVTYTSPQQFCWLPGSSHSIGTTSPQTSGMNRYSWTSWSDGGAMTHNIVSPYTGTATYTANFNSEYLLVFEAHTTLGSALSSSNYATVTLDGGGHGIWDGHNYSVWVSGGTSHLYSYSPTSSGSGSTHRWFSSSPPSGTVSSGDTIRGYYKEQWWFDIDENGHSTPCTGLEGWYDHGTTTYGCVNDSVMTVGTTRYTFDFWDLDASGSSSSHSGMVTMTAARTARANWKSDYAVTFRANTTTLGTDLSSTNYATVVVDGTPHQIWDGHDYSVYFETGTSHSYNFSWTSSGSGIDHRWFCPAPPSGSVSSAATITGNYQEQWWFDIDEGAHSSPCAMSEGWYNHGATSTGCVNDSIIVAGDTRYIFDGWSGDATGTNSSASSPITMDNHKTAIATWRTEYRLELAYADCGPAVPIQTGAGWYSAGSNPAITTDDPIHDGLGRRYDFVDWSGGSFGDLTNPSTTILMDSPHTAVATYELAEVTIIIQTDGTADSVDVDGITYLSPHTVVWLTGSSHTISTDSLQYGAVGTRYLFNAWADGVSERTRTIAPITDSTYTANFDIQYYLTVENGGHGDITGSGWFYAASTPSFSSSTEADETPRERWVFDHWVGAGAISYTGTDNPGYCAMNSPITETAVWLRQFKVFIDDGGHGSATPTPGSYWYYEDSTATAHVTSPDIITHSYCTGWIGTGSLPVSGTDTIVTWTVNDSGTVEWQWDSQLMLIVESEYPGVIPADTTFYDPGSFINATCPGETVTVALGHRAIRLGWTATGSAPPSGTGGSIDFTITENTTITWNWRTEYKLTIENPGSHDSPTPPAGEYWYVRDTTIIAWVTSPDSTWYCLGYHGTGSVPHYSPSTYAYFVMDEPSNLRWDWDELTAVTSLTITSVTDSVSPTPGTYWYRMGSIATCSTISDTVFYPFATDIRYVLQGWTGTGDCPALGDSGFVSFNIYSFSDLNWIWQKQVKVTITSEGSHGSPVPGEGEHWFNVGESVSFNVTSPDIDFWCIGYEGTGSVPDGILDSFIAIIDTPSTLHWLWSDDISRLVVHSDWGAPYPPVDTTNYLTGTTINAIVDGYVDLGSGRRMTCTGWNATGTGIPAIGHTNHVTWDIFGLTELYWLFKQEMSVTVTSSHDTPIPPVGTTWYDSSTTIDASITSPIGDWYCIGWTGIGSAPSGYGTAFSFELDDPASIDWIWEYAIEEICTLFVFSPYGYPIPSGTYIVPEGTFLRATVEDSVFDFGWQVCTGWNGTGSVPASGDSNAVSFTITENSVLTWIWNGELLWPLTVISDSGRGYPDPDTGLHWVPDDTLIDFSVSSPYIGYVCIGWNGTGSLPTFGYDTLFSSNIGMVSSVTWLWEELADVVTLTVMSDYGSPWPHRGVTYHSIDRHISAFIEDTISDGDGIMRLCAGWRGSHSVPSGGDSSHFEFDITENSSIDWQWVNNYHIDLDYSECGTGIPVQSGEGWYIQGETAYLSTDSVVEIDRMIYVFDHWEGGPTLPDTFHVSFLVDSTYDITAVYTRGARIFVKKNPLHTEGYIEIDGHRYWGADELLLWWVLGSTHTISVSDLDTTLTTRYTFDRWSDGGAITHTVGPIGSSMTLIAHYNRQFLIRLEKRPLENVYGRMGFSYLPPPGYSVERWFDEGDSIYVSVSEVDYSSSGYDRFTFEEWSDSGDIVHQIRILEPETLFADYKVERTLIIRKTPYEDYGWIIAGDSICTDCGGMIRWVDNDTIIWVQVSPMDITDDNDSVFYFNNFSDGGANGHLHGPVIASRSLVAYYDPVDIILAVCVDTTVIDFGIVHLNEVVTTDSSQMIRVQNCGDIASTWGLYVSDAGATWTAGIGPALNRFVLRGVFNNEVVTPPPIFNPVYDYIRSSIFWASDDYYGASGWNIPPSEERSMWLQFHAPTNSTTFTNERIILTIQAKVYLP